MNVFVAGHRGMLGRVAARYFAENGCRVVTSDLRYEALPNDPLVEEIRASQCEWVVNAMGRIKQKYKEPAALFQANSVFPIHLKRRLRNDQKLIHASTDCIFSGQTGNYGLDATPDPDDEYGLSKLIGESVAESDRAYVVRTSVIGLEDRGVGLMSWFLQQKGPVRGFLNHFWNGLTTLEWSKLVIEIMRGQQVLRTPILQVGVSPAVSKYELLRMIAAVWGHEITIEPVDAPTRIDRSLNPVLIRRPLAEQLRELKEWRSRE